MQIADPYSTWAEWHTDNVTTDEARKLAALREYIVAKAQHWVGVGEITADWADKKLAKLGITERIGREHTYEVETPVTGTVVVRIYARDRVEAMQKWAQRIDGTGSAQVSNVAHNATAGEPVFISGPPDPTSTPDPDAPTTVDGTLTMLREIILLGHVSGPKFCEDGANGILDFFGLAHIPATSTFVVEQPVRATVSTSVTAYDEDSAKRIAGWRYDNDLSGYTVASLQGASTDGTMTVRAN